MATGPTELELDITGLATGGEGIARTDGRVVFVAGGLPGDRAVVSILEDRDRFLRARLERLVRPSPERRPPPCPIAGTCGGCPWMGLLEPAQRHAKQTQVAELMVRIGGLSRDCVTPIVPSPESFHYRNRLRLHVEDDRIGFRAAGSRQVIDVPRCLVAVEELEPLLEAVRAHLVPRLPLPAPLQLELFFSEDRRLYLAASGSGAGLFEGFAPPLAWPLEVRIDRQPLDPRGTPRLPFAQANHAQNRRLVEAVAAALDLTEMSGDSHVHLLDLYAGAGNFSLPLAGRVAEVLGIEGNARAVAQANEAAPPNARYLAGDATGLLRRLVAEGRRFERVILDPPRAGALEVCEWLPRVLPERIAYVSCDPATLARDLKRLTAAGLRLERITPYDLMPQTAHVECLAVLRTG